MTREEFITSKKTYFKYQRFSRLDFSDLDLAGYVFYCCSFVKTDFTKSNLARTQFCFCDMVAADFTCANLEHTLFSHCSLSFANFSHTNHKTLTFHSCTVNLENFPSLLPSEGTIIGYKKCRDGAIVKLEIAADAKRLSTINGTCRCSEAKVLSITDKDGVPLSSAISFYDENFIYRTNEKISVKDFDPDRTNNCGDGIHFFLSEQEARNYNMEYFG